EVADVDLVRTVGHGRLEAAQRGPVLGWQRRRVGRQLAAGLRAVPHQAWRVRHQTGSALEHGLRHVANSLQWAQCPAPGVEAAVEVPSAHGGTGLSSYRAAAQETREGPRCRALSRSTVCAR